MSTKDRLIEAASTIFAEKGFRDATVAEICEAADANIAAVNYHFGDKESLYDAVWRHAFQITSSAFPIDGNLPENPTLEDYLFSYSFALINRIFCEGQAGLFPKLLHQEMSHPTLALDRIGQEVLLPQNQYLSKAVLTELEPDISDEQLHLCLQSILGQCAFYNFSRPLRERIIGRKSMNQAGIEQLARHITQFSLGGLKAIKGNKSL